MKFRYRDQIVTASSKIEAIKKIKLSKLDKEYIFRKAKAGDKSILKLPKEALMIKDKYGNTPIHLLADKGIKEILKLPKELLSVRNKYGWTPIHILGDRGIKEILRLPKELLVIKDENEVTPINLLVSYFFRRGIPNNIKDLLKLPKEILMISDENGNNFIHKYAASQNLNKTQINNLLKLPKKLLNIKNNAGETPITLLEENRIEYAT